MPALDLGFSNLVADDHPHLYYYQRIKSCHIAQQDYFVKFFNETQNISKLFVNHSKKFPNVFGGYLMPFNILPKKEETYSYTYSLRMGWILVLEVVVKSVPLLRSRCKNSPSDLFISRFMMTFTLCYCNILDPCFGNAPHLWSFTLHKSLWAPVLQRDFL